jgi:hypothetical protein
MGGSPPHSHPLLTLMQRDRSVRCTKHEDVAVDTAASDLRNKAGFMQYENYVSAKVAAAFLGITETFLTRLARKGQIPAHPLPVGNSGQRRTWRFKLSELGDLMERSHQPASSVRCQPRGTSI